MNSNEVNEIVNWSENQVEKAVKQSRTMNQMKLMWARINEWGAISKQPNLESWGPTQAMQMLRYVEKCTGRTATWATQRTNLSIFQKTMVKNGFEEWSLYSKKYMVAKTTLNNIIREESKREVSKKRLTKKEHQMMTKQEVEKIAGSLLIRARQTKGSYELLRKMQYATWVFCNNTGMRLMDVLRLQWDQIQVANGEIRQRVNYSKSDKLGRKRDEIVIHDTLSYPADLGTAFQMMIEVRKQLQQETNMMFPKTMNVEECATSESMVKGWIKVGQDLKIEKEIGAKTPKLRFLNESYQNGTPPSEIHESASWGNNTDIRRFYIKSEAGTIAKK